MADRDLDRLDVIFNDTCPICSREVTLYQSKTGEDVAYHGLSHADLSRFGLTEDSAAREFHVVHEGRLYSGLEAFALLWVRMPRMRWLAKLVRTPGIRLVTDMVYRRVLAPLLYGMHKRRQARLRASG